MGIPVVEWLQEIMPAEEFDKWCIYHRRFPLDDQSNFHYPIAQLEATLINLNRSEGKPTVSMFERLIFNRKERGIEDVLASDDW